DECDGRQIGDDRRAPGIPGTTKVKTREFGSAADIDRITGDGSRRPTEPDLIREPDQGFRPGIGRGIIGVKIGIAGRILRLTEPDISQRIDRESDTGLTCLPRERTDRVPRIAGGIVRIGIRIFIGRNGNSATDHITHGADGETDWEPDGSAGDIGLLGPGVRGGIVFPKIGEIVSRTVYASANIRFSIYNEGHRSVPAGSRGTGLLGPGVGRRVVFPQVIRHARLFGIESVLIGPVRYRLTAKDVAFGTDRKAQSE